MLEEAGEEGLEERPEDDLGAAEDMLAQPRNMLAIDLTQSVGEPSRGQG